MTTKQEHKIKPCHLPRWLLEDNIYPIPIVKWKNVLDHFGSFKDEDGNKIYVSEPYGPLEYQTIKEMIKSSDEHGIDFNIHAHYSHYPGRTNEIEWFQKT